MTMATSATPMTVNVFTLAVIVPQKGLSCNSDMTVQQGRVGAPYAAYLPDVARREPLASAAAPLTRDAVTLFADLAGFTGLSERLAAHGTAGTEQLGSLVRQAIGGALDAVAEHGGDAIAFGGDAITATFESAEAWGDARGAAESIVALVAATRGTPTLAGPLELRVRIGIGGGSVTS